MVNIVTQEDTDKWVEEGWSTRGDPAEMRLSFPNPEPRLTKLLLSVRDRMLEMGPVHAADRRATGAAVAHSAYIGDAAHAMLPNAGQGAGQAFGKDSYILWPLAPSLPRSAAIEAFANFRRVRIPRVHGVQRLALANARFKHMRDSAVQKESITTGKTSVHGNADWVYGYDPIGAWDKEPTVPTAYAA